MSEDWDGGLDPFADPADPAAAAREERRRAREARREEREADREEKTLTQAPPPTPPPPPDPPAPTRSPDEDFWDDEPQQAPEPPEPPLTPRGPSSPGRARRVGAALRHHPFRVLAAILAVLLAWFLIALFQPLHGAGSGRVVVTIPKGASVSEVGDLLGEKGVISSSAFFQLRATIAGKRSSLYAGRYVLAHDMPYGEAIDALSKPPPKATTTVTIPEGYSRPQTAKLAAEDGLTGSYAKQSIHSKYLDPAAYGGKGAKNLEGFLFPDTFELRPHAPAADLVQLQLEDFERRIKGVNMSYARAKNLTTYDVLKIASMIEREAGVASQRKLVAAVIYNRLRDGMSLGIDATVRFATGNYTRPLTESELATNSPYNTRLHTGLPPGPIDSPGLEAIEAAAHPAKVGYLFYVTKPGACGRLSFAKTEAEFESDAARYNAAREAAGGNSPTNCGE